MLSKVALLSLADELLEDEPHSTATCIAFVLAETRGIWHGRARAMLCRRLKHCALGRAHRMALLACVLDRLSTGAFSEQFKDQLRLAMQLDRARVIEACHCCLASPKRHVQRYAEWVLAL